MAVPEFYEFFRASVDHAYEVKRIDTDFFNEGL